ncbi:hypothetical protein Tco_0502409 [Tanacetum coccineum]
MNELTNQSSDSEIFCPEERMKELELRTQRRNIFLEELFKYRFPTKKELAYHKELLEEPQPSFSTLEPKIRKGDPWSLKFPCVIGTVYMGHAYIDLQSPVNIISQDLGNIIDSGLSEVVLGQPFAHTSKLTYDESLGLIRLYLMRRSLEILRKFHWMILGGRFNQLSHVTDIQEKDKNRSQNDKTEHENEKTVKLKSQSQISQVILQSLGNDCVAKHPWGPKVEFKRKSQDDLRAKIDAYSSLLSSHTRKPAKDLEASILSYK